MSNEVITSADQVSAAWLTGVLRQSGALAEGEVAAFALDAGETRLSSNAKLRLTYAPGSRGDRPQKLFLKMVNTDLGDEFFSDSEIQYYFRDYVGVEGAPLVHAYDAAYSETQRRYHLLMDDHSETHVASIGRPLTLEGGLALAEALAALHAPWWGKARLARSDQALPSADAIRHYIGIAEPGAGHIIAGCGDELGSRWSEAIFELYREHPRLLTERTRDASGFTLVHGDMNAFNILVPIEGHRPVYLIDRQPFDWSLTVWLGVSDFGFPLVIDGEPEIRRRLEVPILRHYHEQLIRRGVEGYSWEELWYDYRLSMAMCIYVVTEWCRNYLNMETYPIWMPMLRRAMSAFDDLECANLWRRA